MEVEDALLGDGDHLDLLREGVLVELIEAEHLGAFRPEDALGDLHRLAPAVFLLAGAAHPADQLVAELRDLRPVLAGVADVALAAFLAFELCREAGDVQALVREGSELPAPCHLVLHVAEGLHVDDGLVGVLDEVLLQLAVVLLALLGDRVGDVLLLQEHVAGVGDVGEDDLDVGVAPFIAALRGDAFRVQLPLRLEAGLPVEEVLEDAPHDGGLLRDDDQLIALPAVAEHPEAPVGDALLHSLADSPFDVVADAFRLRLREGGQKRQHDLAVAGEAVDVLLLELDADAQLLPGAGRCSRGLRCFWRTARCSS